MTQSLTSTLHEESMTYSGLTNKDINTHQVHNEHPSCLAETEQPKSYYAKTAYSCTRPRAVYYNSTVPNAGYILPQYKRLDYLPIINGTDLIASRDDSSVYFTQPKTKKKKMFVRMPVGLLERQSHKHEVEYFRSRYNHAGAFYTLAGIGYMTCNFLSYFVVAAIMLGYLIGGLHGWKDFFGGIQFLILFYLGGFCFWKGSAYIARKIPDNKFRTMNRRTGIVTFPQKGKRPDIDIPFAEFEPRIKLVPGNIDYHHTLIYVHQSGAPCFTTNERFLADAYFRAAYLEQFMDVSRPLPDVPSLEWCRDKDPTTAAYDKAHNREPDYWRKKSYSEITALGKQRRIELMKIMGKAAFTT
jgi:hypothetical protein